MPNTKLPVYFEKFLNDKFEDVSDSISELKTHVNDEIKLLREEMKVFRRQMIAIWILLFILLILHIENFGSGFITSFKLFLGL